MERRLRLVAFGAALLRRLDRCTNHRDCQPPVPRRSDQPPVPRSNRLAGRRRHHGWMGPSCQHLSPCPDDFVVLSTMAAFLKRSARSSKLQSACRNLRLPGGRDSRAAYLQGLLPTWRIGCERWLVLEPTRRAPRGNGANDYPPGRPERNTWRVDVLDTFGPPNIPWTVFAVCADCNRLDLQRSAKTDVELGRWFLSSSPPSTKPSRSQSVEADGGTASSYPPARIVQDRCPTCHPHPRPRRILTPVR